MYAKEVTHLCCGDALLRNALAQHCSGAKAERCQRYTTEECIIRKEGTAVEPAVLIDPKLFGHELFCCVLSVTLCTTSRTLVPLNLKRTHEKKHHDDPHPHPKIPTMKNYCV